MRAPLTPSRTINGPHDAQVPAIEPIGSFASHPHWRAALCEHLVKHATADIIVPIADDSMLVFALGSRSGGRRLHLPVHDHLSLDGILIDGAPSLAGIEHGLDDWLIARTPACVLQAGRLPDDSPIVAAAQRGVPGDDATTRWRCRQVARTAWFELDGASPPIPGKLSRNLARHERTLAGRGAIGVELADGRDRLALHRAFDEFLALEASGWKGAKGRGTAIAADRSLVAFYRALLGNEAASSDPTFQPIIAVLRLDGRAIAAQFALRAGNTLSLLKIAYDEREGDVSPGSQLLRRVMTLARADGVRRLSLVTAPLWATRWKPSSSPLWHVARYAPGTAGRTLMHLDDARRFITTGIRQSAPARTSTTR